MRAVFLGLVAALWCVPATAEVRVVSPNADKPVQGVRVYRDDFGGRYKDKDGGIKLHTRTERDGHTTVIVVPSGDVGYYRPRYADDMPWFLASPHAMVRCVPGQTVNLLAGDEDTLMKYPDLPADAITRSEVAWNAIPRAWANGMTETDARCMSQLLELGKNGTQVGWRGGYNTFVLLPKNRFKNVDNRWCRDFAFAAILDGRQQNVSGTACRCADQVDVQADPLVLWCVR